MVYNIAHHVSKKYEISFFIFLTVLNENFVNAITWTIRKKLLVFYFYYEENVAHVQKLVICMYSKANITFIHFTNEVRAYT